MERSTRSSNPEEKRQKAKLPAFFKVFFVAKSLLNEDNGNLRLEQFYHPGKNGLAWFITHEDTMLEVIEFSEPRRSWLIDSNVCSNGKIYMTTPIDVTLLMLHQLRKHCSNKAMELAVIHDEHDPSVRRLMTKFVGHATLSCIADVTSVWDRTFYKYNSGKALAWLAIKTKRLADALKSAGIHCGRSALSQNYIRSEKAAEEQSQDIDFLRMACDIVGGYLDLELFDEFKKYIDIPTDTKTDVEDTGNDKDTKGKRKSLTTLKADKSKKIKMSHECSEDTNGASEKLQKSCLLDDSEDDVNVEEEKIVVKISPEIPKATPLKERVLTAKEKKLAIGAKGTKSISSFFKK